MKKLRFISAKLTAVIVCVLLTGCSAHVRLWGNSDTNKGDQFGLSTPHYVHVGETVEFLITVEPPNDADYAIIKLNNQIKYLKELVQGEQTFERTYDRYYQDRTEKITVQVYRRRGRRDYASVRGSITRRSPQIDQVDTLLGSASMNVKCYQSKIRLQVVPPSGSTPLWKQAVLEIEDNDGNINKVRYGRQGERGFIVLGPEAIGSAWYVYYEPTIDQIKHAGYTPVTFELPFKSRQRMQLSEKIRTR